MGPVGLVGLVGVSCHVGLFWVFSCYSIGSTVFTNGNIVFDDPKEFDDPQVSDSLKVISNEGMDFMIQRNSMIPKYSMIQSEFQLEVWTLIFQKSSAKPPSLIVLLTGF